MTNEEMVDELEGVIADLENNTPNKVTVATVKRVAEQLLNPWQPIETAPKDKVIDIFVQTINGGYRVTDCEWVEIDNKKCWCHYTQCPEVLHDMEWTPVSSDENDKLFWMARPFLNG